MTIAARDSDEQMQDQDSLGLGFQSNSSFGLGYAGSSFGLGFALLGLAFGSILMQMKFL